MPDSDCSFQTDRTWELQQILLSRNEYQGGGDMKKERVNSKKLESNGLQGRGHVHRTTMSLKVQSAPKKARGKESSKHFGVRFRPDLHKWVAEIRVAEWKSVDKKVWLGTFDTEVGAARAVDAARKLLKCRKKRPPNFPCLNLEAYAETIPSHLNLNDLGNDAMFKEVTLFVKHKVQEYAASFGPSTLSDCVSVVTSHPTSSFSQPTTSCDSQEEHKFSFHSPPSFVSSSKDHSNLTLYQDSNFLPCQSIPTVSSSSLGSSYSDDDEFGWAYVNEPACSFDTLNPFPNYADLIIDDQSMVECETMHALPLSSWEEPNLFFLIDDIRDDELLLDNVLVGGSEYRHVPRDNLAYNYTQELTSMDVSHIGDELPSNNCSTNPDFVLEYQRTASSTVDISMLQQLHPFNNRFLGSPLDCRSLQVFYGDGHKNYKCTVKG